ncbi:MAG: SRPBCC family protein, partial [Actinomycetota bacterium]
ATQGKTQGKRSTRVRIEPPVLLDHTHWSSMSGLPDDPEHYETVEWRLSERDGATELTVSEANLPSEEARDLSQRSWRMVLDGLRQLLER